MNYLDRLMFLSEDKKRRQLKKIRKKKEYSDRLMIIVNPEKGRI